MPNIQTKLAKHRRVKALRVRKRLRGTSARPRLNPVKYGAGALQVMIEFIAHKPS